MNRMGSTAAFAIAGLTFFKILYFIAFPPPTSILGWFDLFQTNPLITILDFCGLEIPMYFMFILVFYTLYLLFKETHPNLMGRVLILVIVGSAVFFSTNNPFSMLSLSNQYAAVTTGVKKRALQAAGQVIIANTNQRAVGGFNIGLFFVSLAGLISSLVMLSNQIFSRSTAFISILAFSLSLADYVRQALTQSLVISLLVIVLGAILLSIWFILVGLRLYRLSVVTKDIEVN